MASRLSRLTPDVVDTIYGTAMAHPPEGRQPVFIWMVGAPGAGKSTGHRYMIDNGLLEPGNYATINLDTLLESLTPFRAGSALAHLVTHMYPNAAKFASIGAYQTKKENVGAFGWYNTARPAIEERDPDLVGALNAIRRQYSHLTDKEKSRSLIAKNEAALARAIAAGVDIVYETTLSVGASGKITKVEELMPLLAEKGYDVKVVHVTAPVANIAARVAARQEYGMPYEERPFYRFVPPSRTGPLVEDTARGVEAIRADNRYGYVEIIEIENPADPAQAVGERAFNPVEELARIMAAYPAREASAERETSSEVRSTKKKPAARRTTAKKNSGATGAGGKAASPPKESGAGGGAAKPKRTYTRRKAASPPKETEAGGGKKKSSSSSSSSD
jgi:hypothetical protein